LPARQPLAEQDVREQHRDHRVERAEHRHEGEQPVAARKREERVRGDVGEADRRDGEQVAPPDRERRAQRCRAREQDRKRADARADERRQRVPLPAAEAEEVDEQAERDRGRHREPHGAPALPRLRSPFLSRGEHRAAERGGRAHGRDDARALPGRERERERDDGAAGGDRRDDAHRPERQRAVERREPDAPADAGEEAERKRLSADVPADADRDQQRDESGPLRHDRHGERRQAPRQRSAGEVGDAPHERRREGERQRERVQAAIASSLPSVHRASTGP
jgi:hypothetical protein